MYKVDKAFSELPIITDALLDLLESHGRTAATDVVVRNAIENLKYTAPALVAARNTLKPEAMADGVEAEIKVTESTIRASTEYFKWITMMNARIIYGEEGEVIDNGDPIQIELPVTDDDRAKFGFLPEPTKDGIYTDVVFYNFNRNRKAPGWLFDRFAGSDFLQSED